jgi:hypothetical protein
VITVGEIEFSEPGKRGHEYMWIEYEDYVSNGHAQKRPSQVHVERVYEETDFTLLGIGG